MNDLEQHLKKQTENIRMTRDEKTAMRFRIEQEMLAPSPYLWMFAPRSLAMLGVALLIVLSTGTTYAAEGSLPGAPLYPVKTNIIEPIKVALASSVEAKAQANANIAATRVKEAQTLAAQGNLTPEVVQEISENYNKHAEAALALAASVESEDEDENENKTVAVAVDTPAPSVAISVTAPSAGTVPSPAATGSTTSSDTSRTLSLSVSITAHSTSEGTSSPAVSKTMPAPTSSAPSSAAKVQSNERTRQTSATSTVKTRNFTRQLRESLNVQAQILEDLDAQVRLGKARKGNED